MKKNSEAKKIVLLASIMISFFVSLKSYGGTRMCTASCDKSVSFTCYTGWWYLNPTIKYTGIASGHADGSVTYTDNIFDRCNPFVGTPPACTAAEQVATQKVMCDKAMELAKKAATDYCTKNGWDIAF